MCVLPDTCIHVYSYIHNIFAHSYKTSVHSYKYTNMHRFLQMVAYVTYKFVDTYLNTHTLYYILHMHSIFYFYDLYMCATYSAYRPKKRTCCKILCMHNDRNASIIPMICACEWLYQISGKFWKSKFWQNGGKNYEIGDATFVIDCHSHWVHVWLCIHTYI